MCKRRLRSRNSGIREARDGRPSRKSGIMAQRKTERQLLEENEELRIRIQEAEETLRAIRAGEVDALVISGPEGDQLYTVRGADHSYRILFETMEEGAATLGGDGTILYCNNRLAAMLGIPLNRIIGSSFEKFLPEDQGESLRQMFREENGAKGREALYLKTQKGTRVPALVSFGRTQIGDVGAICLTVTDLTAQKRGEEELRQAHDDLARAHRELQAEMAKRERAEDELRQAQKMEAIGTLAGGIAHDLNNILAPIVINSELALLDLPAGMKLRENLELVLQSGMRAKDLVRQLLLFSRKSGKKQEDIPLSPLVRETFKLLRASLPATIEMKLHLEADSDTVYADSSQMQQVILNLCTNAAYALRGRTGSIDISLQSAAFTPDNLPGPNMDPGEYLALSVQDTGCGMDLEVRSRIFEPFFTTKPAGEGTGLGLSVVYGIVKNHKGSITVSSEPGKGSVFTIYLPKVKTAPSRKPERVRPVPGGGERILFVDDEEIILNSVDAMLRRLGYKVTAVAESREALKLFSENPSHFDLVVTDQTMPGMTGENLGREIMRIRNDIPVILCTGYADFISSEKAAQMGFQGFIMKPFTMAEGAELIRRVLDRKKMP